MENATDKQIAFLQKNNIEGRQMSKQEAHQIISDIVGKPKVEFPVVKPGQESRYISDDDYKKLMALETPRKSTSQSSFYVAYAKDLYVAMLDKGFEFNQKPKQLMQECIDCIKLAKEQL